MKKAARIAKIQEIVAEIKSMQNERVANSNKIADQITELFKMLRDTAGSIVIGEELFPNNVGFNFLNAKYQIPEEDIVNYLKSTKDD